MRRYIYATEERMVPGCDDDEEPSRVHSYFIYDTIRGTSRQDLAILVSDDAETAERVTDLLNEHGIKS